MALWVKIYILSISSFKLKNWGHTETTSYPIWLTYTIFLVLLGSKASIEIDDERTATLIEKVNEILEAFIGIDDLELGKQKKSTPVCWVH